MSGNAKALRQSAQIELALIDKLNALPMTPGDLAEQTGIARSKIHQVTHKLRRAGVLYRVPGTHLQAVTEL